MLSYLEQSSNVAIIMVVGFDEYGHDLDKDFSAANLHGEVTAKEFMSNISGNLFLNAKKLITSRPLQF